MAERTGLYAFGWNGAGQLGTGDKDDMKVRAPPLPASHTTVAPRAVL